MRIVKAILVAAACTLFAAAPIDAQSKIKRAGTKKVQAAKVDIHRASAAELAAALDGVGEKRAAAIVKHRKKGRFKTTDDLLEVPGIGPAIVAKNFKKLGLPRGKRSLDIKAVNAKAKKGKSAVKSRIPGKKATSGKPSTRRPSTRKPSTKKPVIKKPATKKPPTKKPTKKKAARPQTKKPVKKGKTRK